jgi:DNA-binding response OmpR family regulator
MFAQELLIHSAAAHKNCEEPLACREIGDNDFMMMTDSGAAPARPVLLIVDDDQELCSLLVEYLTPEGFAVELLGNGMAALERLAHSSPDLVVLDVMLPELSGFEVLRRIRATSAVPVIMLTARGEEVDRVVGLEMGADDYLPKPFSPRELVARIKAVLRRSAGDAGPVTSASSVQWGPLKIDLRARCAVVNDHDLELTGAEMRILEQLMRADAKAVTRDELMTRALGRRLLPTDRSLDTHVSNLRRKLAKYTDRVTLQSVRGTGYALALMSSRGAASADS